MKKTFKKEKGSVITAEFRLDQSEFKTYWDTAYEKALSGVQLKGFRPGSAPKELAEKSLNKDAIFEEAVERAARMSLQEASQEEEWSIIDQPKVEVVEAHPPQEGEDSKKPGLVFKARLVIFPEVSLGDYKKIAHDIFSAPLEVEVSSDDVEKSLTWLRESRAKEVRVSRDAKIGDVIEADIEAKVDGKVLPGATLTGDKFRLGESRFVPGFDEKLIGHKENDSFEFSLVAPKDYWKEDLREKEINFTVTIKGVFERESPELTDSFVEGFGEKFKTVDDLKKSITEGLETERKEREKEKRRLDAIKKIIDASTIDVPEVMIQKTTENLLEEAKAFSAQTGQNIGDEEKAKEMLRSRAEERVLHHLVLHKIADTESLSVSEEEIKQESSRYPNLDPQAASDYSYGILRNKKVFEFLEQQA